MLKKGFLYQDFMSESLRAFLLEKTSTPFGIKDLRACSECQGLETKESFEFLISIYSEVSKDLRNLLDQRRKDREFIDKQTTSFHTYNKNLKKDFHSENYKTVLEEVDSEGRVVVGPLHKNYMKSNEKKIAPLPKYLEGYHVTLFGPPDSEKMCINAMNAYHRKITGEPNIVEELLNNSDQVPKWGADNEDSKTPLHKDFVNAGVNLSKSLDHGLHFKDHRGKEYSLEKDNLSHPIKRFPGLALPSYFLFYKNEPLPLHLYDFVLHAFKNFHNPEAMVFYVPKLENEEEARYIKKLMKVTEEKIKKISPEYKLGTIKLMIVLENPRAVFRVNEIIDELDPYFAGASLGWHDYLGSTARLFKNDPNYRIPVKADPDIVIKYIKSSHELLSEIVGPRGGIKVGGMYGILPTEYSLESESLQITLFGYFRDVITQLKRDLNGFWVAHPDFVRIGMALVEAWKLKLDGDDTALLKLFKGLLGDGYYERIVEFLNQEDIKSLDQNNPMYARSLLVADIGESNIIANNDPAEIRYNVFQTLQYLTDWLSGNGCVALPTIIEDIPVRVMDDLATSERSRWEVWHEIHHGRFDINEFLKITHEELLFIRKDLSDGKKNVQVAWTDENSKWYHVAFNLMIKLMTDENPVEFATELLLPFTIDEIRRSDNPWEAVVKIDPCKFYLKDSIKRFNYYFEICGDFEFAQEMGKDLIVNEDKVSELILNFELEQVLSAASFHGDIGHSKKTLDSMAKEEQGKVNDEESVLEELRTLGTKYKEKFGFKYLISAQGKTGQEMLGILEERFGRSPEVEFDAAREALKDITLKRMKSYPLNTFKNKIEKMFKDSGVNAAQISLTLNNDHIENFNLGQIDDKTQFEIASLSKSIGTAIALELFSSVNLPLESSVNEVLELKGADFRLSSGDVQLKHLMNHSALNMHYVNGVQAAVGPLRSSKFLNGNKKWNYEPIEVINPPGTQFSYSGAGFILLEYIIELVSKKTFQEVFDESMKKWGMDFSLSPSDNFSRGHHDDGKEIDGGYLIFPAIAAGMFGSTQEMQKFLTTLAEAYSNNSSLISHDTAARMLHGKNLGSVEFMNCSMGLGIFTAEAGNNRLMIHQGANDGYRSLFLHCFAGPDKGKGFSISSNAELNSVLLNSSLTQVLLKEMNFSGIDYSVFQGEFSIKGLKQEEIVNIGYKQLVFDSFISRLPEPIERNNDESFLIDSCLKDSKILSVSNQGFARAENLICVESPVFDPNTYGLEGKVMDSWETVRHNESDKETLHLKLSKESNIEYLYASTEFHDGNHVESFSVDVLEEGKWVEALAKTEISGHSFIKKKLSKNFNNISEVKVYSYPDGGFTRLALFESVKNPDDFNEKVQRCNSIIPSAHDVLKTIYEPNANEIKENLEEVESGEIYDHASLAYGGKVIEASNEHYGPATRVISPYGPIDMFDGMESARSRNPENFEFVKIKLSKPAVIDRIVLDFSYFVNNNPVSIEIIGTVGDEDSILVSKTEVKAFRANERIFIIDNKNEIETITLKTYPDGGANRIHVFAKK